ncbi:galactose-1-phosphate uridylyltransferase [Spirochaeta thermophila]|uniref:Galactose-1-phosphate uridylyltransferase n=1 Tax=Winmispira thermophila (strain ATCC 49972 / DSM 6192 / RI 19.B1) TaxID=665571 RepID=E0RPQ5_WINT6|nr:galactose-1-phosphate uridylyltransferase [Spirochaeta thermophila]ADN01369.1 galactose-1-phosphate uridylyltransferase [Spirochaeta thermophila DSM 6192]
MELRYNVLTGEWVIVSGATQRRPVQPGQSECPICPGGLELPGDYDLVSFENRFPSLSREAEEVEDLSPVLRRAAARGVCEVVVYTSRHEGALPDMEIAQVEKLVHMWCDRMRELSSLSFVEYVFIFENRGKEVGASLPHPHGQIYAFPFLPPRVKAKVEAAAAFGEEHGRCPVCAVLEEERARGERVILEGRHFVALVPFYARFPYEVHIYPVRHVDNLMYFSFEERAEFAWMLKTVTAAYDRLFGEPFPYMMMFFPAPLRVASPFFHFHVEFDPPKRDKDKLKWMASVETGTGAFINPVPPEEAAARLAACVKEVEDEVQGAR